MTTATPGGHSFLVCHPGRQYSHQLALALEERGWLQRYLSGVPSGRNSDYKVPGWLWRKAIRYPCLPIDRSKTRWNPVAPLMARVGRAFPSVSAATRIEYFGYRLFDAWAARQLAAIRPNVVVAYENAALETFRIAKRFGVGTVLDAAAIHHSAQDRTIEYRESTRHHRQICRNKDAEVALADLVITCSEYAKSTYVLAGVPESKIAAIPLGVDLDLFFPRPDKASRGVPTLLFVGATSHRKGIDLLCRALRNIVARGRKVELRIVGPASDNHSWVEKAEARGEVLYRGSHSQDALPGEYRAADCLVLPSRHDSFGMVVPEALASGMPAVVSSEVGAKTLIQDGVSGWIVPAGDVQALEERIEWCVDNIDKVRSMSTHARLAAEQAGWATYRKRVHDVFAHFLTDEVSQSS